MQSIDIYRGEDIFVTIKPDDNSNQAKQVMGDNQLNISFEDNRNIDFKINDHCTVFGERYQLNKLPVVTKGSRYFYRYTLVMNAEGYDLAKANFFFLGSDNQLREADFSLMGTADTFIDLILANANRAGSGWTKGQVIDSEYKNLTFSKENCYNALSRLAEEFETEFWIVGKKIHLTKRSNDTGRTYRHGKNKGLYEITRSNLNDSNVVTRLYAYGSEKNLPVDYNGGAKRLQMRSLVSEPVDEPQLIHDLTGVVTDNGDGTQTIVFSFTEPTDASVSALTIEYRPVGSSGEWKTNTGSKSSPRSLTISTGSYNFRFRSQNSGLVTQIITVSGSFATPLLTSTHFPPQYYIDKNVDLYGVIEHTEYFEEIYPHRTGTVTAVDAASPFKFRDTTVDFDVNDHLLPGIAAKVTFNTGQLAGYTFDISSFNNSSKEFTILQNRDERVLEVPSLSLKPAIGDEYVLIDMLLPQSYIEDAEERLKDAATALLDQIAVPQVKYTMVFDPVYLKNQEHTLNIGDLIWIIDTELELQRQIRVVGSIRNLLNEYAYQLELADTVSPGTISLILNAQLSTDRDVQDIQNQMLNNSILNNNVIGDLKIKLGSIIFENPSETATTTGFSEVLMDSSGKLYKKI